MSNPRRPRGPEGAGRISGSTTVLSSDDEMSAIALLFAREGRFGGLTSLTAAALIALLATALVWLPQLRVIAAVALVQALLGIVVFGWWLHRLKG